MKNLCASDVKKLLIARSEIEAELLYCQAGGQGGKQFTGRDREAELSRQLRLIDSLFALLTEDEEFVVRRHLLDGIDWLRMIKEYNDKWGEENEKTIRSFQIYQTKALRKMAKIINGRLGKESFQKILDERGISFS